MKRYVLANIKIPVVINENGLFDMLNEYTQTEITSLNQLPAIEEEDNLYKKIINEILLRIEETLGEENLQEDDEINKLLHFKFDSSEVSALLSKQINLNNRDFKFNEKIFLEDG